MKALFTFLFLVGIVISYGQTAEEMNKQSIAFLQANDPKNAFPLIQKAAELGNREAQYNYGFFYQQGIEVEKNDSIANIWLLKSAEQGFVNAQFKVAYSYAIGRGIKQDY
ncbi:MAG TPA: tetratricopeptide repeat protein, partial [Chitinophagales bacterium]